MAVVITPKTAEEIRRCWLICNTPGSRCRGDDNRHCSMYDADCKAMLAKLMKEANAQ